MCPSMFHFGCYLYKCTCTHIYILKQNLFPISHLLYSLPPCYLLVEIRHQLLKKKCERSKVTEKRWHSPTFWGSLVFHFSLRVSTIPEPSGAGLKITEFHLVVPSQGLWVCTKDHSPLPSPAKQSQHHLSPWRLFLQMQNWLTWYTAAALLAGWRRSGNMFKVMWKWRLHSQVLSPDVQSGPHFMIGTREIQIPFNTSDMF